MLAYNLKPRGNFTVEFAIVGLFFSLLLVFSGDVIIKLATKGKLDRLSYSLVSVLKERTLLYSDSGDEVLPAEAVNLKTIAVNSLNRTFTNFEDEDFSMCVEGLTFDASNSAKPVNYSCSWTASETLAELSTFSVITSMQQAPVYRVTLSYETDNWICVLLGETFTTVTSSSVMVGR